ncbi:hypothetical protein LDO51_11030 [Providencia alcalifaciens]|uniref:hypothetical protein n=1 Tax=Providencia alcalifaciens TaxID=126385 RepID=UPI001CE10392|nr:hypothetical protein [Providencia alcalifaciens]UBX47728.1 hypothetical protein LDO51_11030 [Providencia alcalifaciens]
MKRSIKNLAQFGCALVILVALPSYAAKYYCNGGYGDATDAGLWDSFFNANSESDAANQAKKKYMGTTPGSYVTVQQCKKISD